MEAAVAFLLMLIFLGLLGFGLAVAYKNRGTISKWLNTPYYSSSDRKLNLQRRKEDAEKELAVITAEEQKQAETRE